MNEGEEIRQLPQLNHELLIGQLTSHLQQNGDLLNSSIGKDIVFFMGDTGSGKSTTIDYLAGFKLKPDLDEGWILKEPFNPQAMKISTSSESETKLPSYVTLQEGLIIYDSPGFNDSRGLETNILNAAFIKKIIANARSVKFVFVAGLDTITASRAAGVKKLTNIARNLFRDIPIDDCSILLITKSNKKNSKELLEFLQRKTKQEHIEPWVTKNLILQVPRPFDASEISEQEKIEIIEVLKHKLIPINIPNSSINISTIYDRENDSLLKKFFIDVIKKITNEELITRQRIEELMVLDALFKEIDFFENLFKNQINSKINSNVPLNLLKELALDQFQTAIDECKDYREQKKLSQLLLLRAKKETMYHGIREELNQLNIDRNDLKKCNLSNREITSNMIKVFIDEYNTIAIEVLNLNKCQIGSDAIKFFIQGRWDSLRKLYLRSNNINNDAVHLICGTCFKSLQELDLRENPQITTLGYRKFYNFRTFSVAFNDGLALDKVDEREAISKYYKNIKHLYSLLQNQINLNSNDMLVLRQELLRICNSKKEAFSNAYRADRDSFNLRHNVWREKVQSLPESANRPTVSYCEIDAAISHMDKYKRSWSSWPSTGIPRYLLLGGDYKNNAFTEVVLMPVPQNINGANNINNYYEQRLGRYSRHIIKLYEDSETTCKNAKVVSINYNGRWSGDVQDKKVKVKRYFHNIKCVDSCILCNEPKFIDKHTTSINEYDKYIKVLEIRNHDQLYDSFCNIM